MSPQRLLVDIGNGRTKFGLASSEAILDRREHATHEIMPDDVYDDGEHKATIYLEDFFSNIDFR